MEEKRKRREGEAEDGEKEMAKETRKRRSLDAKRGKGAGQETASEYSTILQVLKETTRQKTLGSREEWDDRRRRERRQRRLRALKTARDLSRRPREHQEVKENTVGENRIKKDAGASENMGGKKKEIQIDQKGPKAWEKDRRRRIIPHA